MNKIKKVLATGLVLATSFLPMAKAGDLTDLVTPSTVRARIEQTENTETDRSMTKLTLGLAPSLNAGCGAEAVRIYQYNGENPENDYTAISAKMPKIKLGETTTQTTLFGTFSERNQKDGAGIETSTQVGDSTITAVYEQAIKDGKDSIRIGGGLDQRVGNLTLGVGFDRVETGSGTTNYFLGNAVLDINKSNQAGIGLRVSNNGETTTTSANTFYCHYNDSWGLRARAGLDSSNNSSEVATFEIIGAQDSTFGKYSSPWMVGRTSTGTDWFNAPVVENTLGSERVALGDRSKGGLVGTVKGCFIDNQGLDSGFIYGEIGYRFPITKTTSITTSVFGNRNLSEGNEANTFGASILAKAGNFALEVTGDNDSNIYGGITYSHSFGGKK